jgi:UDP-N-acetylglucosamine--N-acetylmuramyl-(pentapeptide) pyrophosphoryl-undecaprenol N-acetylglucosamine transferase
MTKKSGKILLCAGGTGGHVFPAIAMAEEFEARNFTVKFITDSRAAKFFQSTHYDYDIVESATFSGGVWGKLKCIFPLFAGFFQSLWLVLKYRPDAAIGFGGYPTVPPLIAAKLCGAKCFTHESNAILGLANMLLAPFVKYIFTTHEKTKGIKDWFQIKEKITGNPVRASIRDLKNLAFPDGAEQIKIMVVGGSLGAKIFSNLVVDALCALQEDIKNKLFIVQQSRREDTERVIAQYKAACIKGIIKEFYDDMPAHIKDTHLFIARAGAGTITELTMAGRPAIYIPYPHNRDRQQFHNAEQVVNEGGGWLMVEDQINKEQMVSLLEQILKDPKILALKGANAQKLARPQASQTLANLVIETLDISR